MERKRLIICGIIFVAGSFGFAAGYLANREFNHAPIIIEKCSAGASGGSGAAPETANAP